LPQIKRLKSASFKAPAILVKAKCAPLKQAILSD